VESGIGLTVSGFDNCIYRYVISCYQIVSYNPAIILLVRHNGKYSFNGGKVMKFNSCHFRAQKIIKLTSVL